MKKLIILASFSLIVVAFLVAKPILMAETLENEENIKPMASFYDFSLTSINGEEIDFASYKGKKLLLVNVASKCGYTPQYKDLQALHEKYGDKVVVLGFPANNFGSQEPGSNEEIASFCEENYGVTFTMFEKISVKGVDQHPLYRWLSDKSQNGWNDQAPSWNFCKYLIDEEGKLVKFYPSAVNPMSDQLLKDIGA
jgi:glutathione peroxidase